MSRIINGESVERHIVRSYEFKSLEEKSEVRDNVDEVKEVVDTNSSVVEPQNPIKEEVVEKLLEKIEVLSNNIISIRGDFQRQLNECKEQAQIDKQKSFEEGYNKGINDAQTQLNQIVEEKLKLLEESIKKLDEIASSLESKVSSLEKELVAVALDIAHEIIQKEVSSFSKEIALALAKNLIEEVKEATKIEIRANPNDVAYLKENLEHINIVADEAIKEGGIVIVTDAGNIDAEIENRFKAIKEAVLEERL